MRVMAFLRIMRMWFKKKLEGEPVPKYLSGKGR